MFFFPLCGIQVGRLKEMVAMGMDVKAMQDNGILVDTEHDDIAADTDGVTENGVTDTASSSLRKSNVR